MDLPTTLVGGARTGMVAEFRAKSVNYISDGVYSGFVYVQGIILTLTLITFALLVWIVGRSTPKKIGNYKW